MTVRVRAIVNVYVCLLSPDPTVSPMTSPKVAFGTEGDPDFREHAAGVLDSVHRKIPIRDLLFQYLARLSIRKVRRAALQIKKCCQSDFGAMAPPEGRRAFFHENKDPAAGLYNQVIKDTPTDTSKQRPSAEPQ